MAAKKRKKKATKKKAKAKKKKTKAKAKKKTKKKKTKAKAKKRKPAKAKKKKAKGKKRKPNAAFMRPMNISASLAAIVGAKPLPRTQVTKKLWNYIKRKNLQDKAERRYILADAPLKKVFGGKRRVSMFEMTKLVSKHLK
jgi:chromatin remodeling complex protein RSC6